MSMHKTIKSQIAENQELRDDIQSYAALIDMQRKRSIEANALYRKAHPGTPENQYQDLGVLLGWLVESPKALQGIMPFVMEDYQQGWAAPAYEAAVERARRAVKWCPLPHADGKGKAAQ